MCDGLLDCVGGTDEVDCGHSKILHCYESNYCYVWKAVGNVFVAVRVEIDHMILSCILITLLCLKHCSTEPLPGVVLVCAA